MHVYFIKTILKLIYVFWLLQISLEFKCSIQEACTKMSSESNKALKAISSSMKTMTHPSSAKSHIENSKSAIEELKLVLEVISLEDVELIAIIPVATVAAILEEITISVDKIYESVTELSHLAHFKTLETNVSPEKPPLLHRGIIKPVADIDNAPHVEIAIQDLCTDSPDKARKCSAEMIKT